MQVKSLLKTTVALAAPVLWTISSPLPAQPWEFSDPIDISGDSKPGIFHHLDAPGRQHIAVTDNIVAVIWEDNRSGKPAIYVATAELSDRVFSTLNVSGKREAYEPSILAVGDGSFLLAWEEAETVWVRLLGREGLGPSVNLSERATQISLTSTPDKKHYAFWSERQERFSRIRGAELLLKEDAIESPDIMIWIDSHPGDGNQSSPVGAYHPRLEALVVVWEDRRYGNVILLSAIGRFPRPFSIPMQVNDLFPRPREYGEGTGVARPAVATFGSGVASAWADKRKFRYGYDIYFATAPRSGRFGENILVQDSFGEGYEQWHPAIASTGKQLAVAWDDNRDGTSDIWLSWLTPQGWSDDIAISDTSTEEDTHPSLTFDAQGNLHLVWISREHQGAPTQLRYIFGRKK